MPTTRDSLDTLLATLKAELGKPGKSLLPLLGLMSRFPHYSLSNQLLILAQRPDATRVMGFRSWQKAGYTVRKGESGIAIYAPMLLKRRDAECDATDSADDAPRLAYRIVNVFDLGQVEPLPGTAVTAKPAPAEASEAAASHAPLTRPMDAETIMHGLPLSDDVRAGSCRLDVH